MKENIFINLIKESLASSAKYIGDDTAYIAEKDLILTQDTLIEDVHFRQSTISPFDLGIKSIAVNLSDIAASGGNAKYILISLSIPENTDESFIKEYYRGVNHICEQYNVLVVGGDLTRAEKIAISISVVGYGDGIIPAKRSYAVPGDFVIVTGEFGSSRAGLWILEEKRNKTFPNYIPESIINKFIKAHNNPVPKLEIGREIVKTSNKPTALMDASDGLADALYKICLQSHVSMKINYQNIPVNEDLSKITDLADVNPFKWVFYGAEDYELVGTVSQECYEELKIKKVPIKVIGLVIPTINKPIVNVKYKNINAKIDSKVIDNELFGHFETIENGIQKENKPINDVKTQDKEAKDKFNSIHDQLFSYFE